MKKSFVILIIVNILLAVVGLIFVGAGLKEDALHRQREHPAATIEPAPEQRTALGEY